MVFIGQLMQQCEVGDEQVFDIEYLLQVVYFGIGSVGDCDKGEGVDEEQIVQEQGYCIIDYVEKLWCVLWMGYCEG